MLVEPKPRPDSKRRTGTKAQPNLEQRTTPLPILVSASPWKRGFDVTVALLIGVIAAPILLVAGLLIKLTSKGPAFYTQVRLGLDGKPFWIYKLRSMRQDSELDGAQWSKPGDTRITWIGHIIRATHIDELPQLWNVLRGDMSLVGPRPERPEFVPMLEASIPNYGKRMKVRPGVTGLAQVQLPPDTDLDSVRRKLACDLHYAQNNGLWLDIRLIIATCFKVVGVPAKLRCKVLRIPHGEKQIPGSEDISSSEANEDAATVACPQTV